MIRALIKGIFKFVYKILSLFNLQPALAVILIGVLLYFTGVVDKYYAVKFVLEIALVLSAIYAISATLNKMLGGGKSVKKDKKSRGAQIVSQDKNQPPQKTESVDQKETETITEKKTDSPIYYKVKNKPGYIMAEYVDRYELYRITDGGLEKIRTDYKN